VPSDVTDDQLYDLASEAMQYGFQRKSNLRLSTVLEWNYGLHRTRIVLRALGYSDSLNSSFWLYVAL